MTSTFHWDETFPLIRLNGAGARDFLQGQSTADLRQMPQGDLVQSCWLTATGRLRALLELRLDAEGADVLVLAGDADALATGLDQVIFPADRVRMGERRQQRRLQALTPESPAVWVDSEATLPAMFNGGSPLSTEALEQQRLQRGFPPGPGELTGETNPFELGLTGRISLDKGCYLGQETMAKLAGKGGVKQQLRCWRSAQALTRGDALSAGDSRAGVVTSVMALEGVGWIGLALIRRQHLNAGTLHGPDAQLLTLERPALFQEPPSPL